MFSYIRNGLIAFLMAFIYCSFVYAGVPSWNNGGSSNNGRSGQSSVSSNSTSSSHVNDNNINNNLNLNLSSNRNSNKSSSVSSAEIANGAVQNLVSGGSSSAKIASGAVKNTVAGGNASTGAISNVTTSAGGNANIAAGAVDNIVRGSTVANTGNNTGSSNVNVDYQSPRIPVSTAFSTNLTSGTDTCLGSISAGAQTFPVGVTFGATKVDKDCVMIKQTKLLREMGLYKAACYRMTEGKEGKAIKAALKEAGESCNKLTAKAVH